MNGLNSKPDTAKDTICKLEENYYEITQNAAEKQGDVKHKRSSQTSRT